MAIKNNINLDPDGFPSRLRIIRSYRNLKQSEIANSLGISTTVYSSWETGNHLPRGSNYTKLANLLNVPLELLLEGPKNGESIEEYLQFALSSNYVPILESKDLNLSSNLADVIKDSLKISFSLLEGFEKPFKEDRVFLYKVDDDFMTSRSGITLNAGMTAIIINDPDIRAYNGKAALIAVENEKTSIRELVFEQADLVLKCWNKDYPEERINLREKKVNIFGYVALAFKKFI